MAHDETFAAALRRLRGDTSLRALAQRSRCSKTYINDLEHERRSPTPEIAAVLDRAVDAGGRLVALAAAQQGRAGEADLDDLLDLEDDVWRRTFLKGAAAGLGVAAAGAGIGADPSARELLEAHRALRAAHGRLDNLSGAASVFTQAVTHHQEVTAWLVAAPKVDRQAVQALAADTGGFVGFLHADLGMAQAALNSYREAAQHAQQAGDISCCANLVGQASRVLADHGDYRRARDLADRALSTAGTTAHPAVRCWLHAVRAHHHAGLDAASEARADLHTAWDLLGRTDDGEVPSYMGYMDQPELEKWEGHAMWRLGQRRSAYLSAGVSALDAARAAWPSTSVRGSAEVLTSSARVHAARGDRDLAVAYATQAVTVANRTRSARNTQSAVAALGIAQQA